MTKRSDLLKAVNDKLDDVWGQAVVNIAIDGLAADRPDRSKIHDGLRRALSINAEARAMAARAIAENTDLED